MLRTSIAGGALAAAFAFSVPAMAADVPMPDYSAPPPAAAPVAPLAYDWTGVYAGAHVGYGWPDFNVSNVVTGPFSFSGDGFMAGGQVGANIQFDNFVVGVEGDLSWADFDGSTTAPVVGVPVTAEADWLGTIRARAGFAVDRVLVYGTGGVAFTGLETSLPGIPASDSQTHTGWTLGAGVEVGMTEAVSFKAEYLYADFGRKNYNIDGVALRADYDTHIIRAGLNFRFGGL